MSVVFNDRVDPNYKYLGDAVRRAFLRGTDYNIKIYMLHEETMYISNPYDAPDYMWKSSDYTYNPAKKD